MKPSALINLNPGGRLGNHLFNFAWMIEIARLTGTTAINPTFGTYKAWFEIPGKQSIPHWPPGARIPASTRLLLALLNRRTLFLYHHLRITRQWRLDESRSYLCWVPGVRSRFGYVAFDWLVDGRHAVERLGPTFATADGQPEYFSPRVEAYIRSKKTVFLDSSAILPSIPSASMDALRNYFQPAARLGQETGAWIARLRARADVVVGVAVRQGDFRTWGNGADFVDPSLFRKILADFAAQLPGRRCVFALCSDEPIVAEQYPGIDAVSVPPGAAVHLFTLALCDYIVGTANSTFIQWASFLGNTPMRPVSRANAGVPFNVSQLNVFGKV